MKQQNTINILYCNRLSPSFVGVLDAILMTTRPVCLFLPRNKVDDPEKDCILCDTHFHGGKREPGSNTHLPPIDQKKYI